MIELQEHFNEVKVTFDSEKGKLPRTNIKIFRDWATLSQNAKKLDDLGWADNDVVVPLKQKFERDLIKFKDSLNSIVSGQELKNSTVNKDSDLLDVFNRDVENLMKAAALQDEYEFGFLRGPTPTYFLHKTYKKKNKTGRIIEFMELDTYKPSSMMDSFGDILENQHQLKFLRKLLGNHAITIYHPNEPSLNVVVEGFNRTFYRMINTMDEIVKEPGNEMYNMVDLSKTIKPSGKVVTECPWVIKCVNTAIGGCKPENVEWFEKWVYAITNADPGNPMLPMPVIFGEGRTGKNLQFDVIIPGIIGKNRVISATYDVIDSNFNGAKIGKTVQFIDELPPRDCWAKIKNWTGSPEQFFKIKYGPEFQGENIITSALGSNSKTYPLPVEDGKQMMRVSPMKTEPGCTVAEVLFQTYHKMNPGSHISEVLSEITGKAKHLLPSTPFELGDMFLKAIPELYNSPEVLQEYVDYLHTTYYPGDDHMFSLQPLRGEDWDEIIDQKGNLVVKAVTRMLRDEPEYIALYDIEQVYKVMCVTAHGTDRKQQHTAAIASSVNSIMEEEGYTRVKNKNFYVPKTEGQILKDLRNNKVFTGLAKTHSKTSTTVWFNNTKNEGTSQITSRAEDYIDEIHMNGQGKFVIKE